MKVLQDEGAHKIDPTAEMSNRYPFITEHRGGPLTRENHRKLMQWARECAEHVLPLIDHCVDNRLVYALQVAKAWANDKASTGEAMKASLGAHAVAREVTDPVLKAIARSIGQTVATAHMADHSLGGAFYALKAVKYANQEIAQEKTWQDEKLSKLPPEVIEIVRAMWEKKELDQRV